MLKQLIIENWKSFRYAELPIDPLTILIGTNTSGKSNVVEALEFLKRIAQGEKIEAALAGDKTLPSIRGGIEWAAFKPETQFTLKVLVQGEDNKIDYIYSITVQTQPFFQVLNEYIINEEQLQTQKENSLYNYLIKRDFFVGWSPEFAVYSPSGKWTMTLQDTRVDISILSSLRMSNIYEKHRNELNAVIKTLKNIFILNPIPSKMRDYSRLSDTLENDTSNIAGVLAALPDDQKSEMEATISAYAKDLPEGDIQRLWAEKVGRFGTDAILYCEEVWKPGHITEINARSMSDGTLRFLAILTALLTRPEGSQLVIEEVDNGFHPSRAELLVKMLREIGEKRKIDILVTTHNPALLDALEPEIVPFVIVAHRDSQTGESQLTVLENIENFPKLFASASLGKLATNSAIERSLSRSK